MSSHHTEEHRRCPRLSGSGEPCLRRTGRFPRGVGHRGTLTTGTLMEYRARAKLTLPGRAESARSGGGGLQPGVGAARLLQLRLYRVEQGADLLPGSGLGEVIALAVVTAGRPELDELLGRLDAFGRDPEIQTLGERDDGTHNGRVVGARSLIRGFAVGKDESEARRGVSGVERADERGEQT